MNTVVIAFLLGLAPTPQHEQQIRQQWKTLKTEEQIAVVKQFESDYGIRVEHLTNEQIGLMKRDLILRSWDLQ